MREWKVKFSRELFSELNDYLFSTSPEENGCFLLGKVKDRNLFITDIIYPETEEWIQRGEDICIPSPRYIIHSSVIADRSSSSLIFVHSHPRDYHPSSFSMIDKISNKRLCDNLKEVIDAPLGSFVFSRKGIHGVIYNSGKEEIIEKYVIYGDRIQFIADSELNFSKLQEGEFDRQIMFMGKSSHVLSNLNVAIIGLGGIGSPLAVMLAKMGVKNMTLIDHDKIEVHNLPRIFGANRDSIGKFKVRVVKDFIQSFSDAKIMTISEKINVDSFLSNHDVIFGCVDNHTTRDLLNQNASENAIPYIDMACSIPIDQQNKVAQAVIAVSTLIPGKPCLWCNGTLNAMTIMEENLSNDERESREKEGYLQGIEKAPSVITLTSSVASFGINRLLNLIDILPGEYPDKMMFDFNSSMYFEPPVEQKSNCICSRQGVFRNRMSKTSLGVN